MSEHKNAGRQTIITIVVAGALAWYFFGGGLERRAANDLQGVYDQVASDAVKEFEIAVRNGTPMDKCVQAGLVTAAYLQAHDEENYRRWKQTEATACVAAGLNR